MYRVNKKIPTNNINETLMRCYQLLQEKFPTLTLDNRPELRGNNNAFEDSVYYKAILSDGVRDITEPCDSLHRPNSMHIGDFLQFVRENKPQKIIKTVDNDGWMCNPHDYKQVDFSGEGLKVVVKPNKGFFGGYSVELEIEAQEQHNVEVQSMIDKLKQAIE